MYKSNREIKCNVRNSKYNNCDNTKHAYMYIDMHVG